MAIEITRGQKVACGLLGVAVVACLFLLINADMAWLRKMKYTNCNTTKCILFGFCDILKYGFMLRNLFLLE